MSYVTNPVVDLTVAMFPIDDEIYTHELDPAKLIEQFPTDIQRITTPLTIRFRSDIISCDVDYNMFMSKCHKVSGNMLHLGYRKLNLSDIKIELIYKVSTST